MIHYIDRLLPEKKYSPPAMIEYIANFGKWICVSPDMNKIIRLLGNMVFFGVWGLVLLNLGLAITFGIIEGTMTNNDIFNTFFVCIFVLGFSLVYVSLMFDSNKVKDIAVKMEIMWYNCRSDTEKKIILEQSKIAFIITILYFGLLSVSFLGYTFEPIVTFSINSWISVNNSVERSLCVPIYFTKAVKIYYWPSFCLSVFLTFEIIFIINAMNFFQVFSVKFLVGLLSMLGHDMAHIHEKLESSSILSVHEQKMKIINARIRDNIRIHQEIIKLFEALQGVVQTKFLIIIMLITCELSLAGFWFLVIISYDKLFASKMAFLMISGVMILLYLIYSSEDIINACDRLNRNCYDAKWYLFSVKERRLILIMILRTANPCIFTAGPTFPMSYETFSAIMRMILSYLMAFYRIMQKF